jgi:lambda repressor-like predicted transcriptional regulator
MFASNFTNTMEKSLNTTQSSQGVTDVHGTTYDILRNRCKAAGISLTKLCKEAGVNRSVLEDWKRSEPKTLRILQAFEAVLSRIESNHVDPS